MKRLRHLLLLVLACLATAAYLNVASAADSKDGEANQETTVTGTWKGTLSVVFSADIELRLRQSGEMVEGEYDVPNATSGSPLYNIKVRGTFKDGVLSLGIPSIAFGNITATVVGDTMTGKYYGRGGRLNNLVATRVKK